MDIQNTVLCAGLKTACIGTSLTDAEVTEEVIKNHGAKKGSMRVSKTRLKEAIEPFAKLRREARNYFNSQSLPGITKDLRIIPSTRLQKIRDAVRDFAEQDHELVLSLQRNYYHEIEKDRSALGDRFNPSLYPAVDILPLHFSIDLVVCDLPMGDYARITGLTEEAQARMRAEHDAMLVQVGTNARNEVMKKMTSLIQAVADKMSNPDAKSFHETTFSNLRDYLAEVPELNITNDPVLEAMRKAASEQLDYSMKQVKDSEIMKEHIANAAKNILKPFGTMGGRKLVA